jgi:hypothetical protein
MAKAKNTEESSEKKTAAPKKRSASKKGAAEKSDVTATAASESTAPEVAVEPVTDNAAAAKETPQPAPETNTYEGVALPAVSGKAGVLGGPKDRGGKPEDKLALPIGKHFTFERVRSLNPKSFYCAMRWDYKILNKSPEEAKRWWANKKLLVTNPANGNRVVVRAVDFGPHENTGLTISLSPGALEALELEIGGEVDIDFADQKEPVGSRQ